VLGSRFGALRQGRRATKAFAKRSVWGLVSQAAGSAGNLAVTIMVARAVPASDFGAWGLGYGIYILAVGGARAACGTTLLLVHGREDRRASASTGAALGSFLAVALLASSIVAVLAMWLDHGGGMGLWALVVAMPLLLAHDAARYCFFARGESARAAAYDLARLVLQVAGFVVVLATGSDAGWSATAVWGSTALVALPGLVALRALPTPAATLRYLRTNLGSILPLAADFVVVTVIIQTIPFVLAMVAGLEATAGLRAGLVLLGPLNVMILGLTPVVTVEAVRCVREGRRLTPLVSAWSLTIAVGATVCGLVLSALPTSAGEAIAGDSWALAAPLILALALQAGLNGPLFGVQVALNAMGRLREALVLRIRTAVPMLVFPVVGAFAAAERGAAWGTAAGAGVASALAVHRLWRLAR
jgi:O-antigen/teichoic acid export membrane protein